MSNALENLEQCVRSGDHQTVKSYLNQLNIKRIQRKDRLQISSLARRVGLPSVSLRVMNKIIRSQKVLDEPPSPGEIAEYARTLILIGAHNEAKNLLEVLDPNQNLQISLYKAFTKWASWDYRGSIQDLQHYVSQEGLTHYQRLVGNLNLAAALITQLDYSLARDLLEEILQKLNPNEQKVLYGNCLEVLTQAELFSGNYKKASMHIDQSRQLTPKSHRVFHLFIDKWDALCKVYSSKSKNTQPLLEIRKKALKLKHWETVRDCDYYLCLINRDHQLYNYINYGTRFENFEQRWFKTKFENSEISKEFFWSPSGKSKHIFDMEFGEYTKNQWKLNPNQSNFNLLKIFSSDFYAPFPLGYVFSNLFPDEYYDPDSSPQRVYMAISRLNKSLKENHTPLVIAEEGSGYYLKFEKEITIRLTQGFRQEHGNVKYLRRIKREVSTQEFSLKKAARVLNLSPSRMGDILRWAGENQFVIKNGQGRATMYKLKNVA